MRAVFLTLLLSSTALCFTHDDFLSSSLYIQIEDPEYQDGIMTTDQGGVIQGDGIRLQAKSITYTKKKHENTFIHQVVAEGDVVLDYHGQILIADRLDYNFMTQEGELIGVRFNIDAWMIYSEKVRLHQDKSLEVFKAHITTSDNNRIVWEMVANHFILKENQYLKTKGMTVKALGIPIFWVPGFKANLKTISTHPVHYSVSFDSGQKPTLSMRYLAYSYRNFNFYLRGDYQYARGPGGAIEMDYHSEDNKERFQSRNYLANETFYNDDNPNKKMKRYRIQGAYENRNQDNTAEILVSYDKISDKNMPGDFKSDNFELNTIQRTRVLTRYFHSQYVAGFNVEPRINNFQGFKQELPDLKIDVKPLRLGNSGLILENRFQASYLDYVYSNDLKFAPLVAQEVLHDFHSVKAETEQTLYYPTYFKGCHFSPYGGFKGILYSNSPDDQSVNQAVFTYGANFNIPVKKTYSSFLHSLTPYANFQGYSQPSRNTDDVYIFNLYDGFHRLNLMKCGLETSFTPLDDPFNPFLKIDPYALIFFGKTPYHTALPKAGIIIESSLRNLFFWSHLRWNFNNDLLDIGNVMLGYTFSRELAFKVEYRHRSRFDFRKDQHENFILDVSRSLEDLLDSPLSDGRNVILSKAEIKFTPTFTCDIQTHFGWGRKQEPGYTEAKVDFYYLISSAWKLKVSYTHTTRGTNHVGIGLDLIR